ncbi:hypothetical protein [Legionella jamestowniensis]|nr:hypothetical protein [Legionella jamestowniensis]SFL61245.1 hypothetical protein SAMN02746073_1040 [Legionella jamestowniensis DSM 19215]
MRGKDQIDVVIANRTHPTDFVGKIKSRILAAKHIHCAGPLV